jgi:hypothetical protein
MAVEATLFLNFVHARTAATGTNMVDVQLEKMGTLTSSGLGSGNGVCACVRCFWQTSTNVWRQVTVASNIFMMALKILICYITSGT